MHRLLMTSALLVLTLMRLAAGCAPPSTPTPTSMPTHTPAPTATPMPRAVTVAGPRCPGPFREDGDRHADVTLGAGGTLTLTLDSAPSVPCWWESPEVSDKAVMQQVAHHSEWPAEDVTPKPGAPGTEFWEFETLADGVCDISVTCACSGEEGTGEEVLGAYVLGVRVRE